ncbi:hypothetical protein [Actinokineospora iranica]|uniref:Uncharacterized protein n=1 Tax=Actinokineospora iranica TaxID=1271860 RepID=A0A1G6VRM5_9PSEU|nr:hypothetical protein [Actinokineospora iranica]SDD56330.1 hypothetical protein SAMN05216174_11363 [Actinokineospora iranica]
MAVNDPRGGEGVEHTPSPLVDTLYWMLAERLTEFVSTPLAGSTYTVCGVVRPQPTVARVFVFDGDDLTTTIGVDCPLLDADGQQVNHFRHVSTLRRVLGAVIGGADVSWSIDGRGVRVVDARTFSSGGEDPAAGLGEAIYGAVSGTFARFSDQPPQAGAQTAYPVGFLAQSPEVVRVYFRDPGTREVCGYDVPIAAEDGLVVAAGGFLVARIRELAGTGSLASREMASDPYCARAYSVR